MHPSQIPYKTLKIKHPSYERYRQTWHMISILREGAPAIKKHSQLFLKKLPGEDDEHYQYRVDNISYTPIFTQAIKEFISALVSQPLHVSFSTEPSEFWADFRNNVDGNNKDELGFISQLFSSFLFYGRAWVLVNRQQGRGIETKYDEQLMGTPPYIQVVPPEQVINWGDDHEYVITFEVKEVRELFKDKYQKACWQVWTAEEVSKYEAEIKVDSQGNIYEMKNHRGEWVSPDMESATVAQVENISLTLSKTPLLYWEILPELWAGKNAYMKQLQHTRIESSWTNSGTVAGQIQRILTPYAAPMDDPRVLNNEEEVETGTNRVLIGSDFKVVESTGDAVTTLSGQLEIIEKQIKDISSMGYLTRTGGGAYQSGKSKLIDMALLQNNIKAFGKIVCQSYEQILLMVAEYINDSSEISVQGLDSLDIDSISEMVDDTERLVNFLEYLSPTAKTKWFTKLSLLIAGSVSQKTKDEIVDEVQEIDTNKEELDTDDNTIDRIRPQQRR